MRNLDIEQWKKERQEVFTKYGWQIFFIDEVDLNDEKKVLNILKEGIYHF